MLKTAITAIAVTVGAFGLAACDVQKTQEGSVQAPKYEVTKKQEGNVDMPKYDVTAPSVDVNKKDTTVTVPKVTTTEKKITVPDVDVKTGGEKKAEQQAATGTKQ